MNWYILLMGIINNTLKLNVIFMAQRRENVFQHKYANVLLAFTGPEGSTGTQPIGLALYFFNFSTWTGKPGLYVSQRKYHEHGSPRRLNVVSFKAGRHIRGT